MTIDHTQAAALAALIHQLRPDWAPNSLMTLIGKHKDAHDFPGLCKAAVQVATNPEARTPALIFLPGPHWAQQAAPQQYLTAAEKRRLQAAQLRGYYTAIEGTDPSTAGDVFHIPLIDPSDLNPAATIEAFQRGRKIGELQLKHRTGDQHGPSTVDPDILDEAPATGTLRAMAALEIAAQFREQEAPENTHD